MGDRNIFYVFESEQLAISYDKLKQMTRFVAEITSFFSNNTPKEEFKPCTIVEITALMRILLKHILLPTVIPEKIFIG